VTQKRPSGYIAGRIEFPALNSLLDQDYPKSIIGFPAAPFLPRLSAALRRNGQQRKKYNIAMFSPFPTTSADSTTDSGARAMPESPFHFASIARFASSRLWILLLFAAAALPVLAAEVTLPEVQNLVRQKKLDQALEKIDTYLAPRPKDAQGRFAKGLILTELNRIDDAVSVFAQLTRDYPTLPEPYNNLAVLYAQQRQYDKARAALEMAIKTHPSYATAHENLGDVYARLASQAYNKALQLDAGNITAQSKLAMIHDLVDTSRTGSESGGVVRNTPPVVVASAPQPVPPAPSVKNTPPPVSTPVAVPTPPPAPPKTLESPTPPAPPTPAIPPPSAQKQAEADLLQATRRWASAWSDKDVKAYLSAYAPDFVTPKGTTRKEWETERAQRIDKPGKIEVTLSDIQVSLDGNNARVKFRQRYKSATLASTTSKTLIFIRNGNQWLIQEERVN